MVAIAGNRRRYDAPPSKLLSRTLSSLLSRTLPIALSRLPSRPPSRSPPSRPPYHVTNRVNKVKKIFGKNYPNLVEMTIGIGRMTNFW